MGYGSRMDSCGSFMKYSMFIVNGVMFIGGLIVLGLSIWTLVDQSFFNDLLGTNLYMGSVYIIMVTSALVCLISFFGCLGSIKEVRCMLLAYCILVLVIFVTMLVGGVLGYVFRDRISTSLEQEMYTSLRWYGNRREVTDAWDKTQEKLECCGIHSWRDWVDRIPVSCCRETVAGRKLACQSAPSKDTLYTMGCLNVTAEYVQKHAAIIGSTGIILAAIMVSGAILISLVSWIVFHRASYMVIISTFHLSTICFTLASGLVCIPSFFVSYIAHKKTDNTGYLLPILLLLVSTAIALLSIGTAIWIIYRNMHILHSYKHTFLPGQLKSSLTHSMSYAMSVYLKDVYYRNAMDNLQNKLNCCGIERVQDWFVYSEAIPRSCCIKNSCAHGQVKKNGCLSVLEEDFNKEASLVSGICLIVLVIQILVLSCIFYVYLAVRFKKKPENIEAET